MARPMPREPPVTSATLPSSSACHSLRRLSFAARTPRCCADRRPRAPRSPARSGAPAPRARCPADSTTVSRRVRRGTAPIRPSAPAPSPGAPADRARAPRPGWASASTLLTTGTCGSLAPSTRRRARPPGARPRAPSGRSGTARSPRAGWRAWRRAPSPRRTRARRRRLVAGDHDLAAAVEVGGLDDLAPGGARGTRPRRLRPTAPGSRPSRPHRPAPRPA